MNDRISVNKNIGPFCNHSFRWKWFSFFRRGKMKDSLHLLITEVEVRKDELVHLLEKLIQYKTPAPPARNTEEAQNFVASFLKEKDFMIDKWDVYPGDPNVVGVLKGTRPDQYNSLIINGHMDV